jgi:hypothetical protein
VPIAAVGHLGLGEAGGLVVQAVVGEPAGLAGEFGVADVQHAAVPGDQDLHGVEAPHPEVAERAAPGLAGA